MITRDKIVKNTVDFIIKNEGRLSYLYLSDLFGNKLSLSYEEKLYILHMMAVIAYKIPYYENGKKFYRLITEAFQDALTFYNSNKAEAEIIFKSKNALVDWAAGKVLPELHYAENSHDFFESGTGGGIPDLIDEDGVAYEVKRNYFTAGSRSSLHKANYLINCSNHVIELYDRSLPNWEIQIPARFRNVLSPKVVGIPEWVNDEDAKLLISGELIEEIANKAEELGFTWNP
jgi:hypothetical protein